MFAMVARDRRRARAMPRRSPFTSVTPALAIATSVPVPIAMRDVGAREGRRVVDAVSRHRGDSALGLEALHDRGLVGRQDLRDDLVDAELATDELRRRLAVAGQRDEPHPLVVEHADRVGRAVLDRIGDAEEAGEPPVDRDEEDRLTLAP